MDDEDFMSSRKRSAAASLAPKRPPKLVELSDPTRDRILDKPLFSTILKKEEDDSFCISDSEENDKCMVCNRVLSNLNEARRTLHVNSCLDRQESETKQANATEKYNNTIDCPICQQPLPPGPHRIAHIKSCGKKNAISGNKLLEMVGIQEKVAAVRKSKSLSHTKAPVPKVKPVAALKIKGQPRSFDDEQLHLAKALSCSMEPSTPGSSGTVREFVENTPEFTRISDPNEHRRKRPKSFAVVEFAPRSCQCQVLATIQSRFVNAFKTAVKTNNEENTVTERVDSQAKYQRRLVEKTSRYETLANDFSIILDQGTGADLHITCGDGVIPVHKAILLARTRGFVTKETTIRMEEPKEVVLMWLRFVYSGRIEWSPGQEDAIVALVQKYGPDSLCYQTRLERKEPERAETVPTISELLNETEPSTSISGNVNEVAFVLNDSLDQTKRYEEDTICGTLNETNDGEDPMQGINLNDEADKSDAYQDYITIDSPEENLDDKEIVVLNEVKSSDKRDESPGSPDIFNTESTEGNSLDNSAEPWHMTPPFINSLNEDCDKITKTDDDKQEGSPQQLESYSDNNFYDDYYANEPYEPPMLYSPLEASCHDSSHQKMEPTLATMDTPKLKIQSSCRKRSSSMRISPIQEFNELDSFDKPLDLVPVTPLFSKSEQSSIPCATSTPMQPVNKKLNNVKIVKTVGVTPKPDYEAMNDARLKIELAAHGLRPMGRKRAIAKLIEIYDLTHPEIDPSTPTIRPLNSELPGVKEEDESSSPKQKHFRRPVFHKPLDLAPKTGPIQRIPSESSESLSGSESDDGNKTLNSDAEEPAEESMLGDPTSLPKDLGEMTKVFLTWIRKPENEHLHTHMLSLQPVLLEELHMKISRADDPVCGIPKKALATILDNLGVTFSLPLTTRGRQGGGPRRKK